MVKTITVKVILVLSLIISFASGVQAQNEDVSSTLQVFRITTNEMGEVMAERVVNIQPGDTLEYRLEYTNNMAGPISNLQPVLPIPAGLQYIAGTAEPQLFKASLDSTGNTFQSLPIRQQITLESGLVTEREVPARQFRRLQWSIPDLGGDESVILTARMHVLNMPGMQ